MTTRFFHVLPLGLDGVDDPAPFEEHDVTTADRGRSRRNQ